MSLSNTVIANGNSYPRDIGRSTQLMNGTIVFQFGDTFSHDQEGNFIGLSSNTCAVTTDPKNPTLSSYKFKEGEQKAAELIELLSAEGEDPLPNRRSSMYIDRILVPSSSCFWVST